MVYRKGMVSMKQKVYRKVVNYCHDCPAICFTFKDIPDELLPYEDEEPWGEPFCWVMKKDIPGNGDDIPDWCPLRDV
jgi:hypothetical protein